MELTHLGSEDSKWHRNTLKKCVLCLVQCVSCWSYTNGIGVFDDDTSSVLHKNNIDLINFYTPGLTFSSKTYQKLIIINVKYVIFDTLSQST